MVYLQDSPLPFPPKRPISDITTRGIMVYLGESGRNFAARMSGGISKIFDLEGKFLACCNMGLVGLDKIETVEEKRKSSLTSNSTSRSPEVPLARQYLRSGTRNAGTLSWSSHTTTCVYWKKCRCRRKGTGGLDLLRHGLDYRLSVTTPALLLVDLPALERLTYAQYQIRYV